MKAPRPAPILSRASSLKRVAYFLGIDPGLNGALALFESKAGALQTYDMPKHQLTRGGKLKGEIDQAGLAGLVKSLPQIEKCVIEQVGAMPKQGVTSAFAFGKAYGAVIAAVAAREIPVEFVPASVWKRAFKVTHDKDSSRARASQIIPSAASQWARAKDDGRAEAALLAVYAAQGGSFAPTPRPFASNTPPTPQTRIPSRASEGAAEDFLSFTDTQRTALAALCRRKSAWITAREAGGSSHTMRALARRGYALEKYGGAREPMRFMATDDGRKADKFIRELGL